jgi:S-adenosyl-L-methionine hydrolase (adenosine-forming)
LKPGDERSKKPYSFKGDAMSQFKVLALVFLLSGCASVGNRELSSAAKTGASKASISPIVFLSDFGLLDESVAVCKGTMLGVEPALQFVDITHQVPAFSVKDAARIVSVSTPHFPAGSVFLTLVEQHTSGQKRGIVAKSKRGHFFVAPDNGLLTLVFEKDGIEEVREIKPGPWVPPANFQSNFPGRDVYSLVASHLARGEDWSQVGPVLTSKIKTLELKASKVSQTLVLGDVVALDGPFGNLITNVTAANFLTSGYNLGEKVSVQIGDKSFSLPFVKTFDDVPVGQLLLYIDSTDHLAIAINQGNFANKFKIRPPAKLVINKKSAGKKG